MKKVLRKILLCGFYFIVAVVFCEGLLRLTRPDLKYIAAPVYQPCPSRLFWNPRGASYFAGVPHSKNIIQVIHNYLGLRQHRDFSIEKPKGVMRIGFFGDAYVENMRVAVQYSFTEPLDYLFTRLYGQKFEILNFGTEGYATDQSYQQYLDEGRALGLDAVVYFFGFNHLGDNLANQSARVSVKDGRGRAEKFFLFLKRLSGKLFFFHVFDEAVSALSDRGALPWTLAHKKQIDSRDIEPREMFDDFVERIKAKEEDERMIQARDVFAKIVNDWNMRAREDGAVFMIGFVPRRYVVAEWIWPVIADQGIPVISLFSEFHDLRNRRPVNFLKGDLAWNEEGNKYAAVYLFQKLGKFFGYPDVSDEAIAEALYEYYASFPDYEDVISSSWLKPTDVSPLVHKRIRDKYLALE